MKVVTSPGILSRINEKLREAARRGEEVNHIFLLPLEYDQLRNSIDPMMHFGTGRNPAEKIDFPTVTLRLRNEYMGKMDMIHTYRTFASMEKYQGYPVFIIPEEFHPD